MTFSLAQMNRFRSSRSIARMVDRIASDPACILWTNSDFPAGGETFLPLVLQAPETLHYPEPESSETAAMEEIRTRWKKRNESQRQFYGKIPFVYDVDAICRSLQAVSKIEISHFASWTGIETHAGFALDYFRAGGITCHVWERGFLPDTFLCEEGILGFSGLVDKSLGDIGVLSDDRALEIGSKILDTLCADLRVSDRGTQRGDVDSYSPAYPRILVLATLDSSIGLHYEEEFRARMLPGFRSGMHLAECVAEATGEKVLFRPHSNEPSVSSITSHQSIRFSKGPLRDALQWADVVVGYGGSADLSALAMGKPLVLAGKTTLSGKRIAFEALQKEDLAAAIELALAQEDRKDRRYNLVRFASWLATDYLYASESGGLVRRSVGDLPFLHRRSESMTLSFSEKKQAVKSVLTKAGLAKIQKLQRVGRVEEARMAPEEVPGAMKKALEEDTKTLLVDFDHTLLLGNSTKLYLAAARPAITASMLCWIGHAFAKLSNRMFGRPIDADAIQSLLVTVLLPWNLLLWKWKARNLMSQRINQQLLPYLLGGKAKPVVISFGFCELIDPLLESLPANNPPIIRPQLIASSMFRPSQTLRMKGKKQSVEETLQGNDWDKTITISDSVDDADILDASRNGILSGWKEPPMPSLAYFPFRYTISGKYHRTDYFIRSILCQEYALVLITFGSNFHILAAVTFLFVSFFCIYEVGYHENDHVAAGKEAKPVVSGSHMLFGKSIGLAAWSWALAMGAAGVFFTGLPLLKSLGIWVAVLLVLRGLFYYYNRIRESQRMIIYPLLQGMKSFAYIPLLAPNPVGVIACAAHIFQQSTIYTVYRLGGKKDCFRREQFRAVVFFAGVAGYVVLNSMEILWSWQFLMASLWMVAFAFWERAGRMDFLRIRRAILGRIFMLLSKTSKHSKIL